MQINCVEIDNLFNLPCHVYWKDTQGIYRGCNDYQAINTGFSKGVDLSGFTDLDLPWRAEACSLQVNDQEVLRKESPIVVIEHVTLVNNNKVSFLSHKQPLYNSSKKVIGVMGMSFLLNKENVGSELLINMAEQQKPQAKLTSSDGLTKRQAECLYYLVRGMTMKEIAIILKLSKRTIEHYFGVLKAKLNCTSRTELVSKALQMSFIKENLFA